nr:hypothetical protein [Streptomyces roseoverticillatus]
MWAEGPYGGLTARRRTFAKALLIAGGVGITPLRTLFETLPGQLTLLYRARRAEALVLRRELEEIAAARGACLFCTTDEPSPHALPALALTAPDLLRLLPDLTEHDVYACGPPGMCDAALRALRDAGVPRRRIHHESFSF